MRRRLIRLGLGALSATRVERWLPRSDDTLGFVVTLHHVEPARLTPFAPNAHLSITPDFLDAFLTRLGETGWEFVRLDELVLPGNGEPKGSRRIAITLDDGFRDNLRYAWPVFQRHLSPFTIYVCPGFCDATAELWWEALERIVAGADRLPAPGNGRAEGLPARHLNEKLRAFATWARWLTSEVDEAGQRASIRALAEQYGLDLGALARELVMNWDEVRTIATDPLCSIGAHTLTHPALARLSPAAAFREMKESAERIEAEIGTRSTTIAFPYGTKAAASARESSLAEQAGFAASFTTRPGTVPSSGRRHGLPRISVNGLFQDTRSLDALLTPGLWELRDRLCRRAR